MRWIGGEKRLESGLRLWILPRLKGLQRGVVLLTRLIEHRDPGADDRRSARLRGGRRSFAEFEGRAGGRLLTRQGRRGLAHERRARRSRSQRPRRAGRVRIGVGIECVRPSWPWSDGRLVGGQGRFGDVRAPAGAPPERSPNRNSTSWRNFCSCASSRCCGVLQFLDPAVGLAKFFLEPIDAHHQASRRRRDRLARPLECRRAAEPGGGRYRTALEPALRARGRRRTPRRG